MLRNFAINCAQLPNRKTYCRAHRCHRFDHLYRVRWLSQLVPTHCSNHQWRHLNRNGRLTMTAIEYHWCIRQQLNYDITDHSVPNFFIHRAPQINEREESKTFEFVHYIEVFTWIRNTGVRCIGVLHYIYYTSDFRTPAKFGSIDRQQISIHLFRLYELPLTSFAALLSRNVTTGKFPHLGKFGTRIETLHNYLKSSKSSRPVGCTLLAIRTEPKLSIFFKTNSKID